MTGRLSFNNNKFNKNIISLAPLYIGVADNNTNFRFFEYSITLSIIGGANFEVMKMLLDIKKENNVEEWVTNRLKNGDRVMGMGHAVYKTVDPRSTVLKELSKTLAKKTQMPWYDITKNIEDSTVRYMKKEKKKEIFPNVDLYSASVYYMLGIPMDLNTPIFAVSRVAGWSAHVIEERFAEAAPKPMLYRPKAVYVGKYDGPQGCAYIPIDKRK